MANRNLSLFVDLDNARLVQSFLSTLQATLPRFVTGDAIPISFRPLKTNGNNAQNPWKDVDLTGKTVRVAIGTPAGAPTGGTYTITYGAETTTSLPYNADAATISAALNALTNIGIQGGVTVTKSTNGAIRIAFNVVGARASEFTCATETLYPASGAEVRVAVEGSSTLKEVVVMRLETLPAAYAELTTDFPVASTTITEIREGDDTDGAIISFVFDPAPYAGTYTISLLGANTQALEWDSDVATIQTALENLIGVGPSNVTVQGVFPEFTLNFDPYLEDVGTLTIDVSALQVPIGKSGTLNTNTAGMIELLDGATQDTAKFEIELYDIADSTTWTILQADCIVTDDVIGNSASSVTGGPAYVTQETLDAALEPIQDELDEATHLATPNKIVRRGASGEALFAHTTGAALTGTSNAGYGVRGISTGIGFGVSGESTTGAGVAATSQTGYPLFATASSSGNSNSTITARTAVGQSTSVLLYTAETASGSSTIWSVNGAGLMTMPNGSTWNGSTITGVQAFSSTTRPTSSGTGFPVAASLIKYDDTIQDDTMPLVFLATTGSANSSGTSAESTRCEVSLNSGAVVTNNRIASVAYRNPLDTSIGSGQTMRLGDARFSVIYDIYTQGVSNNEYRFLYGVTSATADALTGAGFAVIITSDTTAKLQVWGSSLTESASLTIAINYQTLSRLMVTWNNGVLKLYAKNRYPQTSTSKWALIGTHTGTSVPTNAVTNGNFWNIATVATGTVSGNRGLQIRSAVYHARVIDPII